MRIHVIQHAEFEGPAYINEWACDNKSTLTFTKIFKNRKLPSMEEFDLLLIMGGSMSANDIDKYDWLSYELNFIKDVIEEGKPILGICLGAQLIARSLGSKVYQSKSPEIGWFPILFEKKDLPTEFKKCIPDYMTTFHWHGETFDIPKNSKGFAHSADTPNQGFIYSDRVIALQFHTEVSEESVQEFINNLGSDIHESRYIQPEQKIIEGMSHIPENNRVVANILSYLSTRIF